MTSIDSLPGYKVKAMLDEYGYLDGFTIDETGASFSAPVVQVGYPRETASNVNDDDSIIAIQQYGVNGSQPYNHDVNMRIWLMTPTSGSSSFTSYMARMNEIMVGLRENWRDSLCDVQMVSADFIEGGETDSGRVVYYAAIRVVCDL